MGQPIFVPLVFLKNVKKNRVFRFRRQKRLEISTKILAGVFPYTSVSIKVMSITLAGLAGLAGLANLASLASLAGLAGLSGLRCLAGLAGLAGLCSPGLAWLAWLAHRECQTAACYQPGSGLAQ